MTDDGKKATRKAFRSLFKWGDLILLAVLIVAVALTVWAALREEGGTAEIYIDGRLAYSLSLDRDAVVELDGVNMTVRVKDGKISVLSSDCPEQLCVHSAPIGSTGGMIVCLPNKVVIKVTGKEVDAIT